MSNADANFAPTRLPELSLNPLSVTYAGRNGDVETLDLFAAGGETHFQFETIVGGGIRLRPIERDKAGGLAARHCLTLVALRVSLRTMTLRCSGATDRRIAGNGPAAQSDRMLV